MDCLDSLVLNPCSVAGGSVFYRSVLPRLGSSAGVATRFLHCRGPCSPVHVQLRPHEVLMMVQQGAEAEAAPAAAPAGPAEAAPDAAPAAEGLEAVPDSVKLRVAVDFWWIKPTKEKTDLDTRSPGCRMHNHSTAREWVSGHAITRTCCHPELADVEFEATRLETSPVPRTPTDRSGIVERCRK